jgi:hypothetical protein
MARPGRIEGGCGHYIKTGGSVMKKASFALLRRSLLAAAAIFVAGQPSSAYAHETYWRSVRIEGVWNARVNITNCTPGNIPGDIIFASFDAMNIFARDGVFHDTNSASPAGQSEHFGYWRHLRGRQYEFAMRFFIFDAAGASTGWRIVRHNVVLSPGGHSFTSQGTAETFDSAGVLLTTGCSTSTALRFD